MAKRTKVKSDDYFEVKVKEELPCVLTQDEIREYAEDAARTHQELCGLEDKFSDYKKKKSGEIKKIRQDRDALLTSIQEGVEWRQCDAMKRVYAKKVEYWIDGVCVHERSATDADRQKSLNFLGPVENEVIGQA